MSEGLWVYPLLWLLLVFVGVVLWDGMKWVYRQVRGWLDPGWRRRVLLARMRRTLRGW